jgi:hypothetical protein
VHPNLLKNQSRGSSVSKWQFGKLAEISFSIRFIARILMKTILL